MLLYNFNPNVLWRIKNQIIHDFLKLEVIGKNDTGMCWLAGGSLRGLIDEEDKLVDFDLFFSNSIRAAETSLYFEKEEYELVFKCPKGELTTFKKKDVKVQLITKNFYSDSFNLLSTFDLNAARFAYDGEFVYTDRAAIRAVKNKTTDLYTVTHPNATFKRMLKYRDKGYKITNESIDKFVKTVYDMGLEGTNLQREFYVD